MAARGNSGILLSQFLLGFRDAIGARKVASAAEVAAAIRAGAVNGPLVDEKDEDLAVRLVGDDRLGHLLQQDRLTGARRRDDQRSLTLADRRDEVDHAHVDVVLGRFHDETVLGMQRREVLEGDQVVELFR